MTLSASTWGGKDVKFPKMALLMKQTQAWLAYNETMLVKLNGRRKSVIHKGGYCGGRGKKG